MEGRTDGHGKPYIPSPSAGDNKMFFEFTRKLRLREYFAAKPRDKNDNEDKLVIVSLNMSNATQIPNRPLFPLLAEILV